MDFSATAEDEAFRSELQTWLDANLPEFAAEGEIGDENNADRRTMLRRQAWQRRLHEGRWAAINWPKAWGGREATVSQNTIYSEVMARAKTPGIYNANGLWQIGPMILRWGTEEQQQRWLPGILDADEHWCQGFTEPEAGSDLANLRTQAVLDGDDYVVNGRKIWISTAHLAKWGLFLVRTDPTAIERGAKHEGITALIVDMELPGHRGQRHPRHHRRRAVLRGQPSTTPACPPPTGSARRTRAGTWPWAPSANERVGTAGTVGVDAHRARQPDRHGPHPQSRRAGRPRHPGPHRPAVDPARAHPAAERPGPVEDPEGREELARGARWPSSSGATCPRPSPSSAWTSWDRSGVLTRGGPDAVDKGHWSHNYVWQRYTSIGAGTTEVQKNIIADRAIKMPRR